MMSKKLFVLLVVLMSLSLIGIIFVQAYYINNTVENEERQFTFNVQRGLSYVSKEIEEREFRDWTMKFQEAFENVDADSTNIRELFVFQENDNTNETLIYKNAILEENYKLSSSLFDIGLDSITIMRIINERETRIIKNDRVDNKLDISPEALLKYDQRTKVREIQLETSYKDNAKFTPIHKRTSKSELETMLRKKLEEDGVDIDFEYAIYDNDLATKIQSDNFELDKTSTYGVPIFLDNNNESDFTLYANFPERKKFILSSILGMMLLSIIFTTIIIIAYTSAIYQLIKQRQISQIKTDFINNMTHEFKTPIATINLALDAIRNPKIIDDKEKVQRYLGMIKEENKRMHAQVENVLRISKLEKNELNISKERVKLHDLIEDAISHIELIVEDKKGYVKTHFEAQKSSILANETHFTSVIVNILDNAVKYSTEAPKIDVYTENVGTNILLKIKDQGSGMSKAAQKRVFEKFYREHTGDIHNVKGHGLGLAYVKRIVDDHQGHVSVESEKGIGSTFIIKLPLIS
jgi:signal transduction histidine kinase